MPTRSTSHQLEDHSKTQFKLLLPQEWVVREKSHDYGIDLEVEIFSADGASSGLMFFVQLRATDDLRKAQKLSVSTEQLAYFRTLETPTMFVRYVRSSNMFFWKWHFMLESNDRQLKQKTITIDYADKDVWQPNCSFDIVRMLTVFRKTKSYLNSLPVGLKWKFEKSSANVDFEINQTIETIFTELPILKPHVQCNSKVFILEIAIERNKIKIVADPLRSITLDINENHKTDIFISSLYGMTIILSAIGLWHHADIIAKYLLEKKFTIADREYGCLAALSLTSNIQSSVELAILNDIQSMHDHCYKLFLSKIFAALAEPLQKSRAINLFYESALISAQADKTLSTIAAVQYSWANYHSSEGEYVKAISRFNSARKNWPKYLNSAYFLRELGGTFYLSRKFKCSKTAYSRSIAIEPNQKTLGNYADAQLFTGDIQSAKTNFEMALAIPSETWDPELSLKSLLCDLLEEKYSNVLLPTNAYQAGLIWSSYESLSISDAIANLEEVLRLDAFHPVANFNFANQEARKKNYSNALMGFLICALKYPYDLESWVNAIICSINMSSEPILLFVLATALRLNGKDSYIRFRERIQSMDQQLLISFDEIYNQLQKEASTQHFRHLTIRDIPR